MPINNESILTSTKKLLGLDSTYTIFDPDIIIHINTVLANLVQMGIGPAEGLVIEDATSVWSDFIGDSKLIQQIKTYVFIKVRLIFDPPTNSALYTALENNAKELEVRMYTQLGGY